MVLTEAPAVAPLPPVNQRPTSIRATEHDSFWSISQRVYGVGDYYKALYSHNRDRVRRPDTIPVGLEVATPSPEDLRLLYPHLCPEADTR